MKYILLIIMTAFCAINSKVLSQINIDTVYVYYYNDIIKQNQISESIRITNNTNEDYLTWIDSEPVADKSNKEMVHNFFRKVKGDFSFMQMMYEGLLEKQPVRIGYSFIKNIPPGERFSYLIIKITPDSNIYNDRIVILKRAEVEEYLRTKIEDKYLKNDWLNGR